MIRRLFHLCRFEPVAVQTGTGRTMGVTTAVLMRCACGEVDSDLLVGHWTLEQIKGKQK